jgi:hypothetical protein
MASETREMAEADARHAMRAGGPNGRIVVALAAIIIAALAWLLLR